MGMRKHQVSRLGMRAIAGTAMATAVMGMSPTVLADYTGPTTTNSGTITIDGEQVNDRLQARGDGTMEVTGATVDVDGGARGAVTARDRGTVHLTDTDITQTGDTGLFAFGGGFGNTALTADNVNIVMGDTSAGVTEAVFAYSAFGNVHPLSDLGQELGFGEGDVVGLTDQDSWLTPEIGQAVYDALDGVTPAIDTTVTLNGGSIKNTGSDAYGLRAFYSNSQIIGHDLSIEVDGTDAIGAYLEGSNLVLTNTDITTHGDKALGIYANGMGGPTLPFLASHIDVTGGSINTNGYRAHGVEASSGPWAHQTTIKLDGTTIATQGDEAFGLLLNDNDAHSDGVHARLDGVDIETAGKEAYGIFVANAPEDTVKVNLGTITTTGEQAHGVVIADGGQVKLNRTVVKTEGEGAAGIYLQDDARIVLNGVTVHAAGATVESNFTQSGKRQGILVDSGSTLTGNDGTLLRVHRDEAGMDGVVDLTLGSGTINYGDIVDTDGLVDGERADGGIVNLAVAADAQWTGTVHGLVGDTVVADKGNATFTDSITTTEGLTVSDLATVTYDADATIGGGVNAHPGAKLVFNGDTQVGATTSGNVSAFVFNGDNTTLAGIDGQNFTVFEFSSEAGDQATIDGDVALASGSTTHGGTIDNPIDVTGDALIEQATLGGNVNIAGSLGVVDGHLSPGNSIGVITAGSIGSAGLSGTYHAEVNGAGAADLIHITGGAPVDLSALNLEVGQENGDGGYVLDHDYTVLSADSGLQDDTAFASAELDASFDGTMVNLDPVQYSYDSGLVQISLYSDDQAVAQFHGTANQNGALSGVVSAAHASTAAAAVLMASDSAAALDQVSGEYHASRTSALLADSRHVRQAVTDRLSQANPTTNIWVHGYGSWGDFSGNSNVADMDYDTAGVLVGADQLMAPNMRMGFVVGAGHGSTDVGRLNSSGSADTFRLGIYGGYSAGPVNVTAGLSHAWHDLDADRLVAFDGVSQSLSSDTTATTTQLFGELGYTLNYGQAQVTPLIRGAYVHLSTDGFTEHGGDAALSVDSRSSDLGVALTGVRVNADLNPDGDLPVQVHGLLGWQHTFGDTMPEATMAFGAGHDFTTSGVEMGSNGVVANIGLDVEVTDRLTVGAGYSGRLGHGLDTHGVNANLVWAF